jgi:hypothetical protein
MAEGLKEKQNAWIEMLIAGNGETKCVILVGSTYHDVRFFFFFTFRNILGTAYHGLDVMRIVLLNNNTDGAIG